MSTPSTSSAASTLVYQIIIPIFLILAGLGAFWGLGVNRETPSRPASDAAPLVETIAVEPVTEGFDLVTDGVVVPYREITLTAEVAGRIVTKSELCRAGRYVDAGVLLLTIDPRDFDLEVARLQKELAQADATLQEQDVEAANTQTVIKLAEGELDLQQKELRRLEGLKGVVSEAEIDKARRAEVATRSTLQQWRNQLLLQQTKRTRLEEARGHVEALLAKARLDRERTELRAPVSGVVIADAVELNSYVQKGTLLATIEDTSAVEIECHLRMEEVAWLWRSVPSGGSRTTESPAPPLREANEARDLAPVDPIASGYEAPQVKATVTYELTGQTYIWEGRLSRFQGLGLDAKTRTVPCRVVVPRPREVRVRDSVSAESEALPPSGGPRALVRGMYVTVNFAIRPATPLLAVPERAVRQVSVSEFASAPSETPEGALPASAAPPPTSGNVVWRVRNATLELAPVQVVKATGEMLLLQARPGDLQPGDKVVVSPLATVRHGMSVREGAAP